jgi:thiol:disulfide interchange protein
MRYLCHPIYVALTDYIPSLRALLILVLVLLLILFGFFWSTRHHSIHPAPAPAGSPLPATSYLHGDIYPDGARAASDLQAALTEAAQQHKRVILDFGGNWCSDCRILEIYFHDPSNLRLLNANYVLVPINIGQYDENTDMAARYGIPLTKGVPALVVLDAQGQVLYSMRNGEFEKMHELTPSVVRAFLEVWKP